MLKNQVKKLTLLLAAVGVFATGAALAATQGLNVYTVPAYAMQSFSDAPISNDGYNRWVGSGDSLIAPVQLPTGALVERIEVQGCDTSSTKAIKYLFFTVLPDGSAGILSPEFNTGEAATPGCNFFVGSFTTPHPVNNLIETYYVGINGTTANTAVGAVRIYYSLQISPPPATATFNDVPKGHIFYRAIEALAAAGITGGCGSGNFCPNVVVTRGQMAAFLTRALGL